MPRPRLPDVAHETPVPGEPMFVCRGSCGLVWPIRLRLHHPSYCPNCLRALKRSRATTTVNRERHLRRSYGVAPEWFERQLAAQERKCPICTREIVTPLAKPGVRSGEAVVDHDHKTKLVRGLLCNHCNVAIGMLEDDPERFRRALAYLKKHEKTTADVDAHIAQLSGVGNEPVRRAPRVPEERHDPNESIDSIVSRMGTEVIDMPLLPAKKA